MERDERYRECRRIIDEAYEAPAVDRALIKRSPEYRQALTMQSEVYRAYGFTAFSYHERAIEISRPYKELLPTRVAHFSIGVPLWQSVHSVLMGSQTGWRYKSRGDVHTLASDGRSGIRLIGPEGRAIRDGIDPGSLMTGPHGEPPLRVTYGRASGRRVIRLPVSIGHGDGYVMDALSSPIHVIRIHRRREHGHERYYVLLTIEDK